MKQFSLAQLAEMLGAELRGDAQKKILGLATLQEASADQLSFLANAHYRKQLASTQAGAMLLSAKDAADYRGNCLIVADPYLAYAKLSHFFDRTPKQPAGIHPSAVIAEEIAFARMAQDKGQWTAFRATATKDAEAKALLKQFNMPFNS